MTLLAVVGSLGLACAVYLDLLKKYQIERITSFLNQNSTNPNVQYLLYEVNNAKSAIGSGGIHGAGLFHGLHPARLRARAADRLHLYRRR